MWLGFVVGSRLAQRVFLQVLRFSSLHKLNISKFKDRGPALKPAKAAVAFSLNNYCDLNANEKCLPLMLLEHLRFLDRFQASIRCGIYLYSVLFY